MKRARAWQIAAGTPPARLETGHIEYEKHLEDWIDSDVSIVADDVLLLGRQVYTTYGTAIDLLGIDANGNLVVIELKRDHTLRDTVAQGLEYAEWCSRQDAAFVQGLGEKRYGSEQEFRDRFTARFQAPLPELLNQQQRVLVVAPEISERTERLLAYLASRYGMPINGVSFDVVDVEGRQVLIRHVALDEATVVKPAPTGTGQKQRTLEQFRQAAADNGVGEIFEHLLSMNDILPSSERFWQSFAMKGRNAAGRVRAGFTIYPASETNPGTCDVVLYPTSLVPLYGISEDAVASFLAALGQSGLPAKPWGGGTRVALATIEQAREFERRYREFAAAVTSGAIASESQEIES